jgi:hypothetical protein
VPYRFAREKTDHAAFAAGRLLCSVPGQTAFPTRLADEVFRRCAARLVAAGIAPPWTVYDPCCGVAHLLTTVGFLHGRAIRTLLGSDIDGDALALARRNLDLLTPDGLAARAAELRALAARFGKPDYAAAAADADGLARMLVDAADPGGVATRVFLADALDADALAAQLASGGVDLLITDVPHGRFVAWHGYESGGPDAPVTRLLEAVRPALAPHALVAVGGGKGQRVVHPAFHRVERVEVGKRRVEVLALGPGAARAG